MTDVMIRELRGMAEFRQVEDLQVAVWNDRDRDVFPAEVMNVLSHIGGLVAGAWAAGRLVGMLIALPTDRPGVQHSHMLAVHPAEQRAGLAARLKAFQREWCLARGTTQVEWTYDPLRRPNAHFNIHRLGATARHYYEDFYGEMGGINAGTWSDRLLAVWQLDGPPRREPSALPDSWPSVNDPATGGFLGLPGTPAVRLHIPADLQALSETDLTAAQQWRAGTRQSFQALFAEGYAVTGFVREGPYYMLTRP